MLNPHPGDAYAYRLVHKLRERQLPLSARGQRGLRLYDDHPGDLLSDHVEDAPSPAIALMREVQALLARQEKFLQSSTSHRHVICVVARAD